MTAGGSPAVLPAGKLRLIAATPSIRRCLRCRVAERAHYAGTFTLPRAVDGGVEVPVTPAR